MTRIYALIALACLLLGACATGPDDGEATTDTTGMGGSMTQTPPAVTPPATDPTPAPTSPCAGTPTDDGLECTTWTCVGSTWTNTTSCQTGYACTNTGCVLVAPSTPNPAPNACGNGICETALGECVENCPADCHPVVVTPTCGDKICNNGETTATCAMDCPAPPVVITKPIMTCVLNGSQLAVTFTGPVEKGFSTAPPSTTQSSNLFYGSNEDASGRLGWSTPYDAAQKPTVHWGATGTQIILSSQANAFNFVVRDENGQHWFALDKWDIKGDCVLCDPAHVDRNVCRVGNQRIY